MHAMQRLEGLMRKAMQSYGMIAAGDCVCVAVSGGKDSVALTIALNHVAKYYELPFTVQALTLDPLFGGKEADYSPLEHLFAAEDIPYTVQRTNIGHVVFDLRREKNPCALCAKMRRGALHATAKALGCNKIALGHHLDDAVETFFMNLFVEGRIGCFSPNTWLSRREIGLIRPMVLAEEREVVRAVRETALPVVKSLCPADGATERERMKQFVAQRRREDPAFLQKTIGAMQKANIDGWRPSSAAAAALI